MTSFFGSYIAILGGILLFDKFPDKIGQKSTINDNIISYLPYTGALLLLAVLGMLVQRKYISDKQIVQNDREGID